MSAHPHEVGTEEERHLPPISWFTTGALALVVVGGILLA